MDSRFPDAQFEIRIQDDEMLSSRTTVFIRLAYSCPCYDVRPPQISEYIKVCGITPSLGLQRTPRYSSRLCLDYRVSSEHTLQIHTIEGTPCV